MNYYPYGGFQPRRSGSGGGCGCAGVASGPGGLAGPSGPSGPTTYQSAYQPVYQPVYQMPMGYQASAMTKPIDNPAPSSEVLRLLEEAVVGEKEDRIFYQQLINLAPTKAEKDIIAGIREDEISHFAQFRQIYRELTGNEISTQQEQTPEEQSLSYVASLRKALFGEMAAVKTYRAIRAELTSKRQRDILFNIITDELTHMGKYNYLITINKRN